MENNNFENEMMLQLQQIQVVQGSIVFSQFENIKQQAIQLAEDIQTVEVNEDNLKQSKKLLAAVNKRCKELDDERIRIKKLMLEPYTEFEEQVKEIVAIVKDADAIVRQQVKDLEEAERMDKQQQLEELFHKRKILYTLGDLIPFEDFLKPKHLNKTTSIEAVEKDMVEFLEQTEKDVKVLKNLPDVNAHVSAYIGQYDLALAMTQVNQEKERRQQIEAAQAMKQPTEDKIAYLISVKVYNQKELKFLEMLLQQNGFEFDTDKIGGN